MKHSAVKTNAVRLLESAGILRHLYEYEVADGRIDALAIAEKIGVAPDQVFKTLVTQCAVNHEYFVFVVPATAELDLKLRGAGDINGTLQSGMAFDLKIASPTADVQILTVSREAAAGLLSKDPKLAKPENRGLEALRRRYSGREEIDFSRIS